ncbi:TIGR03936 family radical SAM-associated protein [[Clostridium] leptum]|nr:TIGR03936 family radical SAM-associated protein [[Clostridium] leptum]
MIPIRFFFEKKGAARFISHLDVNRCMARAVRRAHLPLWYTEGFNPHPYLTFPLPLSLGVIGLREPMDLRLVEEMDLEEAVRRLNGHMPEDVKFLSAAPPIMKAKDIAWASYELHTQWQNHTVHETAELLSDALSRPTLCALKRTKKGGQKEVDVKPHIYSSSVEESDAFVRLRLTLPAGTSVNINPTLVLQAVENATGVLVDAPILIRDGIFNADLTSFL